MKKLIFAALMLATLIGVPSAFAQRYWHHEHYVPLRPHVYAPVPFGVVPAPMPVCPVRCWPVNVCNPYGWCHWERHCEPRC